MSLRPSITRRYSKALVALAAVLGLASPVLADGVSPDRATAIQREQAQARFKRGKELLKNKKHDEALREFQASHDIVSSPNTRLMIARCQRELGRLVEAYAEFGRTSVEARELERADRRYRQAAETAEQERKAVEDQLGFVKVEVRNAAPGTTMKVGGEQIRRAAWEEPAPVLPGSAEVVLETPGRPEVRKSVVVAAGSQVSVTIDAGPPPDTAPARVSATTDPGTPGMRTWAYVAGGVGVVGLGTFAVAGTMANGTYDDLEAKCGAGPCPAQSKSDIDAGRTQQTVANVGLVVGALGLATGVTLFLLSKPSGETRGPDAAVVVSPGWVGVRGRM